MGMCRHTGLSAASCWSLVHDGTEQMTSDEVPSSCDAPRGLPGIGREMGGAIWSQPEVYDPLLSPQMGFSDLEPSWRWRPDMASGRR